MLDWLKFTFGSFIFNRFAKEGATRKFWNVIFALFMVLLILTTLFSMGLNLSFYSHFKKANEFKDFAYNIFCENKNGENLNINVTKVTNSSGDTENAIYSFYNSNRNENIVINSYEVENDKSFSKNGYNVIIDTRNPDTTFVKFDIVMYYRSDNTEVENLDYEKYLSLSDSEKSDYSYYAKPTNEVITLTEEEINNDVAKIEKDIVKDEWENIKKLKDSNQIDYFNKVYDFYIRNYYNLNYSPNIVHYYQAVYADVDEKGEYKYNNFLILTQRWGMVSFKNDKNVKITYDGYYTDLTDNFSISGDKQNVDYLVTSIYESVSYIRVMLLGIQLFTRSYFLIIALAILALFIFCVGRARKNQSMRHKYAEDFKIVSSFLIGASALAGIIALICFFITDSQIAISVGIWSLLSILSIRTFIYTIIEIVKNKNVVVNANTNSEAPIDINDNKENNLNDLSKVDTGTKVIINNDVDDDDDEKMELM